MPATNRAAFLPPTAPITLHDSPECPHCHEPLDIPGHHTVAWTIAHTFREYTGTLTATHATKLTSALTNRFYGGTRYYPTHLKCPHCAEYIPIRL